MELKTYYDFALDDYRFPNFSGIRSWFFDGRTALRTGLFPHETVRNPKKSVLYCIKPRKQQYRTPKKGLCTVRDTEIAAKSLLHSKPQHQFV
jgi:hypothetical protein